MIESIARRISVKIHNAAQNNISVEVMAYSLGVYMNFFAVVVFSGVIGWVTGYFAGTMIATAGFGLLRIFSGGFHLKSLTNCALVSILLFCIIPFVHLSDSSTLSITLASAFITALYSPTFRHLPKINGNKRLNFKIISTILVIANIFILSPPLALAFLSQSLTLIHIWGGEQNEKIDRS